MQGFIQVYTGNGKGKTTAALGLALRAAGAGMRVYIAQFAKGTECSELKALRRFDDMITIRQYGTGAFILGRPGQEDIEAAGRGLEEVKGILAGGNYDVVILDEANIATHYGLITPEELLAAIDARKPHMEVIVTGRYAHAAIIARADLVTEMHEIKHYFTAGVQAREGIEQ